MKTADRQDEQSATPSWFAGAIADAPERSLVATARGQIEALSWGRIGDPGLLLVHGNGAHADWWSFIAPFFASRHRVVAMSLPGMGESEWRESYREDDFPLDADAVAAATGLHQGKAKPVYIGHSFGGRLVLRTASGSPGQLSGAILIDTAGGKSEAQIQRAREEMIEHQRSNGTAKHHRVQHDLTTALARFRLMPAQSVENTFILAHIAEMSLRRVPGGNGTEHGWIWKFDPENLIKHQRWSGASTEAIAPTFPIAHIIGERSSVARRNRDGGWESIVEHEIRVPIPEAAHHVLIDQPLALVSAIKTILSAWRCD